MGVRKKMCKIEFVLYIICEYFKESGKIVRTKIQKGITKIEWRSISRRTKDRC